MSVKIKAKNPSNQLIPVACDASGALKNSVLGNTNSDGSGDAHHLHIDSNGNARVSLVSSVNTIPANSVNSGITNDPANSVAVGMRGRTDIADAGTETFINCDATGKLIISNTQNIGVKLEDLSSTINSEHANHSRSIAVGLRARTNISDETTGVFVLAESDGRLGCKTKQDNEYGSEVSYLSSQAIAGSGSHTGSTITLPANAVALWVEYNFSATTIHFEVEGSIDNSNFFTIGDGVAFNDGGGGGGPVVATFSGLVNVMGSSLGQLPPFIRLKFHETGGGPATLTAVSYLLKTN